MLKVCSKCGLSKRLEEFYQRKSHRVGEYYERCKECYKARGREYYHKNHERQLTLAKLRKRKRIKEIALWLNELKNKPCTDCGKKYPPWIMDFDHREGEVKLASVSNFARWKTSNTKTILKEILKCDLVCSNCHRQRTYDRLQSKFAAVAKVVKAGA